MSSFIVRIGNFFFSNIDKTMDSEKNIFQKFETKILSRCITSILSSKHQFQSENFKDRNEVNTYFQRLSCRHR